jgi:hypothetical protein
MTLIKKKDPCRVAKRAAIMAKKIKPFSRPPRASQKITTCCDRVVKTFIRFLKANHFNEITFERSFSNTLLMVQTNGLT